MRNDDLTKLARWIIPGWLFFLTFLSFVAIDLLVTTHGGKSVLENDVLQRIFDFIKDMSGSSALLTAVVGAAAGVPAGFVVYQLYFFLRWNSPFSRDGLFSLIPGRRKDLNKSIQGLRNELSLSSGWRKEIMNHPLYEIDHSFTWRYIEPLFIQACQKLDKDSDVSIFSRHRYLHEVVHTLGASIGSLYLGFLGYLMLRLATEDLPVSTYLLSVFLITSFFFALLHLEDDWRYKLSIDMKARRRKKLEEEYPILHIKLGKIAFAFPSTQFLFTLSIVHFFGNPRFGAPVVLESDFLLRVSLTALILGLWIVSSLSKKPRSIIIGNAIWAIVTLLLALFLTLLPNWFTWIDWTFFFNLLLFLFANLILFSNRRNASEDMLALEYNTLRRFLDEK